MHFTNRVRDLPHVRGKETADFSGIKTVHGVTGHDAHCFKGTGREAKGQRKMSTKILFALCQSSSFFYQWHGAGGRKFQ